MDKTYIIARLREIKALADPKVQARLSILIEELHSGKIFQSERDNENDRMYHSYIAGLQLEGQ